MGSTESSRPPERTAASWRREPEWTLVTLTLIPRLAMLASSLHRSTPFGSEGHDGYLQIAQNIVASGTIGFDSHHLFTRGPLFPLLLVPGVAMGHPEIWSAALHLAFSVATCLLVFAAAKTLTGTVPASFCAAALVTLDPWLIWFAKDPMTTVTATFFVSAAIFFFAQFLAGDLPIAASAAIGLACALAALDHPALIALAGGFTLAILVAFAGSARTLGASFSLKTTVSALAVMWISFAIVLLPYAARNFRDSGRPILISDGAGLSYFMGATRYELSPYPWANVHWPFEDVAGRLHVTVPDLDVQYFTIDDRFYPELGKLARADLESLALHHPAYLAKRTAVMAFWFLAGDFSVARTAAHCVFLGFVFATCWVSWRTRGWTVTAPFLVIMLPGLALHSFTMALIGHAAYAIPYIVPLSVPLAFALTKQRGVASSQIPASQAASELYAFE